MCKVPVKLRELVKQRLAAAAEEIFELLERTITEYEEEAERQRRLMETLLQPRVLLRQTTESAPRPPSVQDTQTRPETPHIKQEPTEVFMKSEEEEAPETWTQPVHHNQTVDCPELPVPVSASGDQLLHHKNLSTSVPKKTKKRQRKTTNRVTRYVCSFCDKVFSAKTLLEHMRTHTAERPFSCSVCGKRFATKGNMGTHMKIHSGLKPYSCTVCGKAFVQKTHLNNHLLVHTGEKPFSCSVCGKQFRNTSNMTRHMSTHREPV